MPDSSPQADATAGLEFDVTAGVALYGGRRARLSPSEGRILAALIRRAPNPVLRGSLYEMAGSAGQTELGISVLVCRIRDSLASLGLPRQTIRADWGRGYSYAGRARLTGAEPPNDQKLMAAKHRIAELEYDLAEARRRAAKV